jgi:hypothetical protein
VKRGHELAERLEGDIRRALHNAISLTNLEPLGDPSSWDDMDLERRERAGGIPAMEQPSKQGAGGPMLRKSGG